LDGSQRAEAILSHVESIAKSNDAKVFFLKVDEEPITPEQVDFFLAPQLEREAETAAKAQGAMLATGLNVSLGAAVGIVAFDSDLAAFLGRPI
jgi:hypothetical protein